MKSLNPLRNEAGRTLLDGPPNVAAAVPRVALICDFLEEKWPSMDLVGEMLFRHLTAQHSKELTTAQLRPSMRKRLSRLPWLGNNSVAWNADRLMNRFGDYPRWLRDEAERFDLFHLIDHSYSQLVSELPPDRTVVTCHDLDTFRCLLEPMRHRRPRWFRAMTQKTLDGFRRAAHVICISHATKNQLLRYRLFSEDRLSVISLGVDPIFSPDGDLASDVKKPSSAQVNLLHVGSTIPRKRIDTLLRVFASILRVYPRARLERAGGPFTAEQAKLAGELQLDANITVMPFLRKEDLAAVYRRAAVLLQTSDAEGFGLPVVEAMASGCPVVASDIPALRETGGSAVAYCPVGDIPAWSETVLRLLHERQTCAETWRSRQDEGLRRAERFTWTETAKQTVAVYRRVI